MHISPLFSSHHNIRSDLLHVHLAYSKYVLTFLNYILIIAYEGVCLSHKLIFPPSFHELSNFQRHIRAPVNSTELVHNSRLMISLGVTSILFSLYYWNDRILQTEFISKCLVIAPYLQGGKR